jgi:STE24 endopeptidase
MNLPPLQTVFAGAFVALLALGTALRLWLAGRQSTAIRAHRGRVPRPFADSISLPDHQRAADYTLATLKLGRVSVLVDAAVTLALTVFGLLGGIDSLWERSSLSEPWRGALVILTVVLLTAAIDLPFSIWRTFRIEARFGFNRTSPGLFAADLLKSALLAVAIGGPVVLGALTLMDRAGGLWWLWAWGGWLALMLLMTWAWPAVIAPLFNKFSPLADSDLRSRLE